MEPTNTQEPEQPKASGETFVTTLNIKAMDIDPRVCFTNKTTENPRGVTSLCKVFGRAVSLKHGENRRDNSVWTALSGKFIGLNVATGKIYNSGKLFLPSGIQDIVEKGVIEIQRLVDQNRIVEGDMTVQFAFEIRSKTADNPIGYTYEAVNLMPPTKVEEKDPLKEWILKGIPMPEASAPVPMLEAAQTDGQAAAAVAQSNVNPMSTPTGQHKRR